MNSSYWERRREEEYQEKLDEEKCEKEESEVKE